MWLPCENRTRPTGLVFGNSDWGGVPFFGPARFSFSFFETLQRQRLVIVINKRRTTGNDLFSSLYRRVTIVMIPRVLDNGRPE